MRPPSVKTEVTIQVPQRERLAARVDAEGPDFLVLALMDSPRTPMRQLQRMRVFCEYVNEDGVIRLLGIFEEVDDATRRKSRGYGVSDVVRFAFTTKPQLLQRRAHIRANVTADVHLCRLESNSIAIAAKTVDVSGGGLLVRGLGSAREGDLYSFELSLFPGQPRIKGTCRVMRITADGLAGVQFTKIDTVEQDRIVRWAFGESRSDRNRAA